MWSYYDGQWDPEGIVSTIPAIATTIFGVLTGQLLKSSLPARKKAAWMVCAGVVLLTAGLILSRWLPINKSLWTSTFSIFMAGMALVCFAFFQWMIDVENLSSWAKPLIILGLNPITVYVLSIVLDSTLRSTNMALSTGNGASCPFYLFGILCVPIAKPEVASLLYAFSILIIMFLIAWFMWRRRVFIKI
jgi:predicted acyltransferase